MESNDGNETSEEIEPGQERELAKEDTFEAFMAEQLVSMLKIDQQHTVVKEYTNLEVPECSMEDAPQASGQASTEGEQIQPVMQFGSFSPMPINMEIQEKEALWTDLVYEEERKEAELGKVMVDQEEKEPVISPTKEHKDCFAWSYNDLPGLDRLLVEHRPSVKPNFKPYKKKPRRMSPEVIQKVKKEIARLLKAGFIKTARYAKWLSNIVPVIKKNGKLRVCIDFRNLNLTTPKDEYPCL
ncbi:uncharacterized protein LOC114311946 [Camellia sinensis]|uniref:uncharacterized protein LOC114311946 n=1 Tax=Camellia sinensis TaxID=4442 RepID=UPI0010365584|nr:uncharacterized protein LOC114311946 [Camellia sinensis]